MKMYLVIGAVFLSGCTAGNGNFNQPKVSAAFSRMSEPSLCATYTSPSASALVKMMIEAELGVRKVKHCSFSSYGNATASTVGKRLYARTNEPLAAELDKDCTDFGSGASAQRYFLASGGPVTDRHNLDADGDGLACEWGAEIRKIARYTYRPATYSAPRRSRASRTCYTGPRGGTYTITSSGNKNYGGC